MVKNCSQMHMIYFKLYKCEVSMVGMLIRPKNTGFVPLVAFKGFLKTTSILAN